MDAVPISAVVAHGWRLNRSPASRALVSWVLSGARRLKAGRRPHRHRGCTGFDGGIEAARGMPRRLSS